MATKTLQIRRGNFANLPASGSAGEPFFTVDNGRLYVWSGASMVLIGGTGFLGTVTSVNLTAPAAGITVAGGPITGSGSITLALANDLAALEALTGTDTIYYRSGVSTWTAVTIGSNLTFSGGTLSGSAGTTDHTALSNLGWTASAHVGSGIGVPTPRFAAFNGSSHAAEIYNSTGDAGSNVVLSTSPGILTAGLTTPDIIGAATWQDGVRQTFNPDGTTPGLNVGSNAGDPSAPSNGDLVYNSTSGNLRARINGAWVSLGAGASGANPSASVGLAAVNGSAATFLRSDGAPSLSQAIVPTWTGQHIFNAAAGTVKLIARGGSSESVDLQQWQNDTPATLAKVTKDGHVFAAAGTYTGAIYPAALHPYFDSAANGNDTTTETDLFPITIKGGTFATNSSTIWWRFAGNNSAAIVSRQYKVYLDGTLVFDTGAVAGLNNFNWRADVQIQRTSSTNAIAFVTMILTDNTTSQIYMGIADVTVANWTSDRIAKATVQTSGVGAGSDQIVGHTSSAIFCPAA